MSSSTAWHLAARVSRAQLRLRRGGHIAQPLWRAAFACSAASPRRLCPTAAVVAGVRFHSTSKGSHSNGPASRGTLLAPFTSQRPQDSDASDDAESVADPPDGTIDEGAESLASSDVIPDDIEEPDESRKETLHEHEPGHTSHEDPASTIPPQGIDMAAVAAEAAPAPPPFTPAELEALVADLKLFNATHPPVANAPTALSMPPLMPDESASSTAGSSSAGSAGDSSNPPAMSAAAGDRSPGRTRPFLASWSVKEVCAWYLQVEEQLGSGSAPTAAAHDHDATAAPAPPAASSDGVLDESSFLHLLLKHRIDGARLLSFTSEPGIIPHIPPALLSRILYLSSLDSRSQLYDGDGGAAAGGFGILSPSHATDPNMRHLEKILHATVKIFCTSTSPDFARPWQQQDQTEHSSSGFVIAGRRILCNAHGVTHATSLRVRKHGDATKYKATVHVISHEADLALLHVASDSFWSGVTPLKFGSVPRLQDTVIVVGYPSGGDSICVTKGVVSRVLVSNYVHSEEALLTIQIDAAINAGNSGGPVLLNGAVIGVAFQGVSALQSVGFIIPVPVVQHFLSDLSLHQGRYSGFPSFHGLTFQKLEHEGLKKFLGLTRPDDTGILLMDVAPCDGASGVLRPGDVLTHIDGTPVADDGSIYFREGERLSARYLPATKFVGDTVRVNVVRDQKRLELQFALQPKRSSSLVATHLYDTQPSYFVLAGLVFTPLSRPYLVDTFGRGWAKRAPVDLLRLAYYGVLEAPGQEVVLLSTILVDDVNAGYGASFHHTELRTINGHRVHNMQHLVQLVERERKAGAPFLRFDFTLSRVIILDAAEAFASTSRILQQNSIEHDRSADLRDLDVLELPPPQQEQQQGTDAVNRDAQPDEADSTTVDSRPPSP